MSNIYIFAITALIFSNFSSAQMADDPQPTCSSMEACAPGKWKSSKNLDVFDDEKGGKKISSIKAGHVFETVGSRSTGKPGTIEVLKDWSISPELNFKAGDSFSYIGFRSIGEARGVTKDGRFFSFECTRVSGIPDCLTKDAVAQLKTNKADKLDWLKIKTDNGLIGWIRPASVSDLKKL